MILKIMETSFVCNTEMKEGHINVSTKYSIDSYLNTFLCFARRLEYEKKDNFIKLNYVLKAQCNIRSNLL